MAKKLSDIKKKLDESGSQFKDFLNCILPQPAYEVLETLSQFTDVYIFSGVIRNFFLKKNEIRDIDIVLQDEVNVYDLFKDYKVTRNSFGGYKIYHADVVIDLWFLKNTWALIHQPSLELNFNQYSIPGTAFFNFSAVIYSFREQKFYANQKFLQFLRDKTLDVVYKPNANYSLCVVNTLYYEDKYNLKVSDRLKRHISSLHKTLRTEYKTVQQKHFGEELYSEQDIHNRITSYVKSLRKVPHCSFE